MPDTTAPPQDQDPGSLTFGMDDEESTSVTRDAVRSATEATGPLFDELLLVTRSEAEAPAQAASPARDDRLAELRQRAAWLAWDGRGDSQLAATLVTGISHPSAWSLALDLAIDAEDTGAVVALTEEALARGDSSALAVLGERLLVLGDASWPAPMAEASGEGGSLAVRALQAGGDRARESLAMALGAGGRWEELRALREQQEDLVGLVEAAQIAHDRLGQPAAALELLRRAVLIEESAASDAYVVERMIELSPPHADVWRRKIELLSSEPGGMAERAAAQFRLAELLDPGVEAASLLASLVAGDGGFGALLALEARAQVEAALGNGSAAAAAWASRAERLAVPRWARALWRRSAELYEARGGDPAWAEGILLQLHIDEPRDLHTTGSLVRLRLAHRDLVGIADVLASSGRACVDAADQDPTALRPGAWLLLRGARVVELGVGSSRPRVIDVPGRIGSSPTPGPNPIAAATANSSSSSEASAAGSSGVPTAEVIARYREALAAIEAALRGGVGNEVDRREALEALLRLYRQAGNRAGVHATYAQLGHLRDPAAPDPAADRRAAACLVVAGGLSLEAGRIGEAEALFNEAAVVDPGDVIAVVGRALCARAVGRALDETDALTRALELAQAAPTRARLLRRMAQVRGDELGDANAAAEDLERALALHPDDPTTLHHFARLCGERGQWDQAVEMRERAVAAAGGSPRAVALLVEIGDIQETQIGDAVRAVTAYQRALEIDPSSRPALVALAALHRRHAQGSELVEVLRRQADVESDPATALGLQLEIASLSLAESPLNIDAAIGAWREALRLDPSCSAALDGLRRLCEREGRRDALAAALLQLGELRERRGDVDGAIGVYREAFDADPSNRNAFTSLERACYRRQRWPDVMALYEQTLSHVEQRGLSAYRPADLYARRARVELECLHQTEEAASSWLRAMDLDPENDAHQTALERLFSASGEWPRLIATYERRADRLRDPVRRADVLRRAVRTSSTKLADSAETLRLQARLLAADPADAEALDALERHYTDGASWLRLIEVLRARVAITSGGDEAIALHLRIATICEEGLRDAEQAIEAYKHILTIAPSHREALDALARLYEGTERWAELVETSRRQIRLVTDRPQKALLFFKCGSVMESKFGRDDEAIRYYDAAIKTSSTCLPAVHGLRDLYLRREDWPKVIESLQLEGKLWSEDKERAVVYAHIGSIYQHKLGEMDRAVQFYESALATDRECLAASRSLFEVYFARAEYSRALPLGQLLTQKVVREGDPAERSEFYRKRAVVAYATGDARAAAEALVAALEIRPEHLEAVEFLVELSRAAPTAFDFAATFTQLERLYRRSAGEAKPVARLLARALVGLAVVREGELDIEGAEQLLGEALGLASGDLPVILANVDLQVRLRRQAIAAITLEAFLERCPWQPDTRAARRQALVRLAEIHGDVEMDAERALATWSTLVAEAPEDLEAHFRMAQEQFVLRRFTDAQKTCERLIELATAPGRTAPPEQLARYYDYLGRIAEARGDQASAGRSYRRAVDLDPQYPAPLIALARRAASGGDYAHGVTLIETASRALTAGTMASGPSPVAVELKRGLARLHVSYGQPRDAIPLLRSLVDQPGRADIDGTGRDEDRLAVAELYIWENDLPRAARELEAVLGANLRHAMAWRLLMQLHDRAGHPERAARVAGILRLLGYSDIADTTLRNFIATFRRGTLSDELRRARLMPMTAQGLYLEAYLAVHEGLEASFPAQPLVGVPSTEPAVLASISEVQRLLGTQAEVRFAKGVPGGVIAYEARQLVVMDESLAARPDGDRRFLLGRALEPLRAGYSLLLRLGPVERAEVGRLLDQLFVPTERRDPSAEAFVRSLSRKSQKLAERLVGATPEVPFEAWAAALAEAADRAGLVACDDVGASARMLARLGGEELAVTDDGAVLLGQVHGGESLVRFFLSDAYDEIRAALGQV